MKYLKKYNDNVSQEKLPNVPVLLKSIDDDAYEMFVDYLTKYPVALGYEFCASQIHPIDDTLNYFKFELRETEHESVRLSVNEKGYLDLKDMEEWIRVNKSEMIERKLINN